jgi:hypothetical protein
MPCWKKSLSRSALGALLALTLSACLGETPERARILEARLVREGSGVALELTQELRFSRTMREALDHGIPLRLVYSADGCGTSAWQTVELRYVPLTRHYELQHSSETSVRSFARRSALFAALDRVRLPLHAEPRPDCSGRVWLALDLVSLPTPLRLPAFLQRAEWRLVSPVAVWSTPSPRA